MHRISESLRNRGLNTRVRTPRTWWKVRTSLTLCMLISSLCIVRLWSQTATGSIEGTVADQIGNVIANARVTLINVDTNQVRAAKTDNHGYYGLTLLPPANYSLSIEATGFRQFLQPRIKLEVGDALTINAAIQVGQVSEKVTVTSEPSALQSETSSLGQVIANQPIVDLPVNGRNSYSFATLVPGVLAS
jgi:hypothetical protein